MRFATQAVIQFLLVLTLVATASPGHAAKRALVIGNDQYVHQNWPTLTRARMDAEGISDALRRANFTVTLRQDRNRREMLADLRAFQASIENGDEVVLYFSGHGLRLDGRNYLAPIDARGDSRNNARDDSISLAEQLDRLRARSPTISLVIIDACRNDPFPSRDKSTTLPGLAGMSGLRGQLVLYAAGEGQVALDRLSDQDPNPYSVFTRVLLEEMASQSVPIQRLAFNVRSKVYALARQINHEQAPAIYDETLPIYDIRFRSEDSTPGDSTGATDAGGRNLNATAPARPSGFCGAVSDVIDAGRNYFAGIIGTPKTGQPNTFETTANLRYGLDCYITKWEKGVTYYCSASKNTADGIERTAAYIDRIRECLSDQHPEISDTWETRHEESDKLFAGQRAPSRTRHASFEVYTASNKPREAAVIGIQSRTTYIFPEQTGQYASSDSVEAGIWMIAWTR